MNWLERARLEMQRSSSRTTANSAERSLTAVMAVPDLEVSTKATASVGRNGSTPSGDSALQVGEQVIDPDDDDRRRCTDCTNLTTLGNCLAAWRAEIIAGRDYKPVPDIPRRCEGYSPKVHDPDQQAGRERWRGLPEGGVSHGD